MTDTHFRSVPGASCVVWPDAPSLDGAKTASVGRLHIGDPAAGRRLFEGVCGELKASGYGAVLGPMEGDTWHAYRVVTYSDGSRPFAGEPESGVHDHAALLASGFAVVSEYASALAPVAAEGETDRPDEDGLRVENWDGRGAPALLAQAYRASMSAFAGNRFYKPIAQQEFLALYEPVIARLDPRLVLFAKDSTGAVVGFLLGYPDYRSPPDRRLAVLKTYASLARGAGRRLAHRFHIAARDLGYAGVVHALMHVENASLDRSGKHRGTVIRRYALMGRPL